METLRVRVNVNRDAAIRAGKTAWGRTEVLIDELTLSGLTPEEREELILALNDEMGNGLRLEDNCVVKWGSEIGVETTTYPDTMSEATADAVIENLRKRIALRKLAADKLESSRLRAMAELEELAAARAVEFRGKGVEEIVDSYATIHPFVEKNRELFADMWDSILAEQTRKREAIMALRLESERKAAKERELRRAFPEKLHEFVLAYFASRPDERQCVARAKDGLLPEEEALALVRDSLFGPLDAFPRYERLSSSDLAHSDECTYGDAGAHFDVEDTSELTSDEYTVFKAIEAAAPSGAKLRTRLHQVKCSSDSCHEEAVRVSVLVSLTWNGRELSREYALNTND